MEKIYNPHQQQNNRHPETHYDRKLPWDAQIGLIGHELSHVADFSTKNMLQGFWNLYGQLFSSYVDRMEYHTDMIAVEHGLGKYLGAWSSFIRETYHIRYWRGAAHIKEPNKHIERYMNPETIEKYMC